MKPSLLRLLLAVLVTFVPIFAFAQETHSIPVSAQRVTTLSQVITFTNGDTCARLGLARNCTQAQACVAPGCQAVGGASCTAAQARTAGCRIWIPGTLAGREEFSTFYIAQPRFDELAASAQPQAQHFDFCTGWAAATNTNKDSVCTTLGLPTGWVAGSGLGCNPC